MCTASEVSLSGKTPGCVVQIVIKTSLPFPGNVFNSLQGKDPFTITSKTVQISLQNQTLPQTEHFSLE